jgi:hypothetical protein
MSRLLLPLLITAPMLLACAADPRLPESSYQWERRQNRIERDWRAEQASAATPKAVPAQTSTNGASTPEDRF